MKALAVAIVIAGALIAVESRWFPSAGMGNPSWNPPSYIRVSRGSGRAVTAGSIREEASMRRRVPSAVAVVVVVAVIAMLGLAGGAGADDDGDDHGRLVSHLTGEAEVPGPGDPDGSGSAQLEFKPQHGEVCFDLGWEEIDAPTAAHIHFGPPDVAGPIVVTFFMTSAAPDQPPTLPETITGVSGCTEEVTVPEGAPFDSATALLRDIKRHPREYYVNIHNLPFPDGAIRGQLRDGD
jgi:hypothetical protein